MPNYTPWIIDYVDEIEKTIRYIKETNTIAPSIHRGGIWSTANVQVSIDNYDVFSICDWEETFKVFVSAYDNISSTSDFILHNGCSLVKHKPGSKEINLAGNIYTINEAFEDFEEIYFQNSTLVHQCALDAFEMLLLLEERKVDMAFLLTTPLDLDIIRVFNNDFNIMLRDAYEKFGKYRDE